MDKKWDEKYDLFGSMSHFRKDKERKPILPFGQDEAIFKQYTLSSSSWFTPDGTSPLRPKCEGHGVMVSAFTSQAFGFGFDKFEDIKEEVNNYRKGKNMRM